MPFYEYACGACGARHEALQRISDEPLVECPACGAPALTRLISAPAFRLKGGGWYETDFKSGNKRNLAESGDAKPAEAKPDGGSKAVETPKPAAKAEPKPAATPAAKSGGSE